MNLGVVLGVSLTVSVGRAGLVVVLFPATGLGQLARVKVVEQGGKSLPGVLVSLEAEGGPIVRRALADDYGRATLSVTRPGRYRIRGDRIGHEGARSAPFAIGPTDTLDLELVMPSARLQLAELEVKSSSPTVCRLDREEGNLMANLWGEVRKALWGTELAREQRLATLEVRSYRRRVDRLGRITHEQSATSQLATERPFVTESPARLSQEGFVTQVGEQRSYHAPDALLLLSDEFTRDHCFQVRGGDSDAAGLLGLRFEPRRGRELPDVAGTLWIDPSSSELRYLEYRYANLNLPQLGERIGGRIEFARLATGNWIISAWRVKVPVMVSIVRADFRGGKRFARDSVVEFAEWGGEARPVSSPTSDRALALEGTVFDSVAATPLSGVVVSLGGGTFRAVSDDGGRFRVNVAAPGDYVVTLDHSRFGLLGMGSIQRSARFERGVIARLEVAIPAADRVFGALCPTAPAGDPTLGVVVGRLDPRPAGNAMIEVTWPDSIIKRTGSPVTITERGARIRSSVGGDGYFRVCGVPRRTPLRVRGLIERRELFVGESSVGDSRVVEWR